MHKYQLIRLRAEELRKALEQYAPNDKDVVEFLLNWMPWYERIQRREIRLPCYECDLGIYFTNPRSSPFAKRYGFASGPNPLRDAWWKFEIALLDRLSSADYLAEMRANGEEPDLIPDEPPPLEEELPLGVANTTFLLHGWRGWLLRLVFGNRSP